MVAAIRFRLQGTKPDIRRWEFVQEYTYQDITLAGGLRRLRRRFDDEVALNLARHGFLYGSTIGYREASIEPYLHWKVDGRWLDDAIFPPDPKTVEEMSAEIEDMLSRPRED